MDILFDTNVLADYLLTFRPRHAEARRLFERLEATDHVIRIPAHAFFELFSTAFSEWRDDPDNVVLERLFRPPTGRRVEVVPIDLRFVRDHFVRPMPMLRAGDLPYALLWLRSF